MQGWPERFPVSIAIRSSTMIVYIVAARIRVSIWSRLPSGAKAQSDFVAVFGTTKVMACHKTPSGASFSAAAD
jgi:hypothetical protein